MASYHGRTQAEDNLDSNCGYNILGILTGFVLLGLWLDVVTGFARFTSLWS